jgi:hypothetical protein
LLLVAVCAGCATVDQAGDAEPPGVTLAGVRVVGTPRGSREGAREHRTPDDAGREARERALRADWRFKVWMVDWAVGRAFFPGIGRADGVRLGRTAKVEVEVIADDEIYPVERDPYSRRAQVAAQFAEMARFNRALFRELDRMGRIAPARGAP